MSLFDGQINEDAVPAAGSAATTGASTGFSDNFRAAFNEMYHVRSAFGADEDMADVEQKQLDNVFRLTGQRFQPLFPGTYADSGPSKQERFAVLHSLAGDPLDADQQKQMADAQKQIDRMGEVAQQYPGVMNYDQMFAQVRKNAAQDVSADADVSSRSTWSGWAGGLAGGAAGSFTPRDPINLASLALGGVGKSAIARIASEVGVNSLAQGVELLTGSYENQALLNQAPTGAQMAEQVAGAGIGAGVFRGGAEAGAAGFRALVSRFGGRAPDVAAGAIAKEAEDAIGPSPYGNSRAAEGLHTSEVLDAVNKDAPLNVPGLAQPDRVFTAGSLAGRESDKLFAGTSEPLANIFDRLPAGSGPRVAEANHALTELTDRIGQADNVGAALDQQIAAKQDGAVATDQLFRDRAKVADLESQIAGETNPRKVGQLQRDKATLETSLARAEAVNADLQSLVSKRQGVSQIGDALRLNRSQIVSDTARGIRGVKKGAVASDLASTAGPDGPRPVDVKPPTTSEDIEKTLTVKPATPAEGPVAKVIPPETPKEGAPEAPKAGEPGSGETVDIGQRGPPVSLDHQVVIGYDDEGKPIVSTIRDLLQDHKDNDALVKQMKECLI